LIAGGLVGGAVGYIVYVKTRGGERGGLAELKILAHMVLLGSALGAVIGGATGALVAFRLARAREATAGEKEGDPLSH
jgi:hypothetical protein